LFIFSYKGENKQSLTKPFELVPLTHIDQVIQAGHKTYIRKLCTKILSGLFGYEACKGDFNSLANRSRNQYTEKQYKLWEPMDIEVTYTDPYNKTKPDNHARAGDVDSIGNVGKKPC